MTPDVSGGSGVSGGLARYLVEVRAGPATLTDVQALSATARRGAEAAADRGEVVRFLRVVFLPADGSRLLLFEADSGSAVRAAVELAGLHAQRVARSIAAQGAGPP